MGKGESDTAPMHIKFDLVDPTTVPADFQDDFEWLVAFGQSPGPYPCHRDDHSSWVKITRTGDTSAEPPDPKDVWTIESQDHPNNVVCLFSADNAFSSVTEHGHFHMPFRMTVEIDPEG